MDESLKHRGSPYEFSAFAYGVATFHGASHQNELHRELLCVEIDYAALRLASFRELLPRTLARFDIKGLRHAWLSWEFPDRLGTVISWGIPDGTGGVLVEYGLGPDRTFSQMVELEPESLRDLADEITPELDNSMCMKRLGRVFSIGERWNEVVAEYLVRGADGPHTELVAPGYVISVRRKSDAPVRHEDLIDAGGIAAGGELPSHSPWLARPLRRLAERELALHAYLSPRTLLAEWKRIANRSGLEFAVAPIENSIGVVTLTNELGFSLSFDASLVLHRAGTDAHSLGDQALLEELDSARILLAQVSFLRKLPEALPEGYVIHPSERDGKVKISHPETGERIIDLWSTPLAHDLEDEASRARFLETLGRSEPGPFEGPLVLDVVKELHSRRWLHTIYQRKSHANAPMPLHVMHSGLVTVYTAGVQRPGENPAIALLYAGASIEAAEARWRAGLPESRWQAEGVVVRAGRLIQHRFLVLVGQGISQVALHGGLIRGLVDAAGFPLGRRAHVYAPRSGLLVIGSGWTPQTLLRQVAYRFFIEHAREHRPHVMGDNLHFRARVAAPPAGQGLGHFQLSPLSPPWNL